ncbi:hypothetical protein B4U80_13656 [Leptotrombidium deliense]|uniref:MFS-type transporter SLC18B1-like protein n=1 Tax=Leptotrombidium deliense TaxID=299467 RepID=A0A443SP57_9ACAR|nr:hypothetical protein B4U80_13656 [Leptotrombidium deliense]
MVYRTFPLVFSTIIIEGIGLACINTTAYYLIAANNKAMAVVESCMALGTIFGFVFGAVLFEYAGFCIPFVIFGCLIVSNVPLLIFSVDSITGKTDALKSEQTEEIKDEDSNETILQQKLTFGKLLIIPKIVLTTLVISMSGINMTSFGPFMQTFLLSKGVHQSMVSLAYTSAAIAFLSTAILVGRLLGKENGTNILIIGAFISAIAYFLNDTSIIHPYDFRISFFAFPLWGISNAMMLIPTVRVIRTIGPSIGGMMNENLGFLSTSLALSLLFSFKICTSHAIKKKDNYEMF